MRYLTHFKSDHADWVVFIHGIGGNHTIFYKQMEVYKEHYNLLFVDLPSHGDSDPLEDHENTLEATAKKVIHIMDNLHVESAHFIGLSLGSIILQHLSLEHANRIKSMIIAGGVAEWKTSGLMLAKFANLRLIRSSLSYMTLFRIFSYVVMPKNNHKRSRDIFIREAKELGSKKEFIRWSNLAMDSIKVYKQLRPELNKIQKLYISGNEDHMFNEGIIEFANIEKDAEFIPIEHCGHVCSIEKYDEFNKISLGFLKSQGSSEAKKAVIGY